MKQIISIVIFLMMISDVLSAERTDNMKTTANMTINYYGEREKVINILTNSKNNTFDLNNGTYIIEIEFPHKFTYDCVIENISTACNEISQKCNKFIDYLNDSLPYVDLYAKEVEIRAKAEESTKFQNEQRKLAEDKLAPCDEKAKSYERYFTEYKICQVELNNCGYDLINSTSMVEMAESSKMSWGFSGAVLVGIAFWVYTRTQKPRKPDKDIKEILPIQEPS